MDYTIDDVHRVLEEISSSLPESLFEELNGGIVLLDEISYHDKSIDNSLLVLGNYVRFGVRRQINIFYKSIKQAFPMMSEEMLNKKLTEILTHELQHHTEFRARLRDLEIEDEININKYLEAKKIENK